ncbi:radical SAM protein [Candidatus Micrarchaeota archaeon]|nr:radical SAM protein [Candidatus Micrarchaeota archaeon]
MSKKQIFRKERFGGVRYNSKTLRFKLVSEGPLKTDKVIERDLPKRTDILSAPVRIYFELTRKCNLACKHCFANAGKSAYGGLELKAFEKMLDDMWAHGVIDIRFTGGEPTVREDWFDILNYAKRKGFVVSLNTNGIYADHLETTKKLASLDLDQVTISLDGLEKEHDYFRGKGTFRNTMRSMEAMADAGINLRFNTVITKLNVHQIPQIIAIANGLVEEINFFYMRPIGRGIGQNHLSLNFEEHFESAKDAIALRPKYPNLNIMHFEQSFIERSILNSESAGKTMEALPYGNTTLAISCDGGVWPHGHSSFQDQRLLLGNLMDESLRNIWTESERLDSLRQWFRDLLARCRECGEYLFRCAGLNFEMEIAKLSGDIEKNQFCISNTPVPPSKCERDCNK